MSERHNAYTEDNNEACMALFQAELHHHERMVRLNLRHARQMDEYIPTPGVVASRKRYMSAVRSHRIKAGICVERWAWFAKREKHVRIREAKENHERERAITDAVRQLRERG